MDNNTATAKLAIWNLTALAGSWDGPYPLADEEREHVEAQKAKYLHEVMFTGYELDY